MAHQNIQTAASDPGATTPVLRTASLAHATEELSAERLDTATNLLSGWVWETDASHRFTYISDSVEQFTGRPAPWHYGKTRDEIGNLCEPRDYDDFIRRLEAREPFSAVEFRRQDRGKVVHMRTAGQPFYDGDQFCGYRGLAYRISDVVQERRLRRIAEREKMHMRATLEEVLSHCPFGVVVFDVDMGLLFANAEYYSAIGMTKTELPVGSTLETVLRNLIARDELRGGMADDIVSRHVELARSTEPFTFERSRTNGRILKVHGFPLPGGGFARTFLDITERTEDKWNIASLKQRLNQIVRTMPMNG